MVSLIIPTYKSYNTISYCLDSVIRQSFDAFECLIIDYPEDNKTKEIVDTYIKEDKRLHYLKAPYKGAMAQREFGIKNAIGDYICFLDSDDVIHSDYIKTLFDTLKYNDAELSICEMAKCKLIDIPTIENNKNKIFTNLYKGDEYKRLIADYRYYIGSPTPVCIMAKKEIFLNACNYYNKDMNVKYWEDAILSYYLFFNSSSVVFCKHKHLYYYINNSLSVNHTNYDIDKYFNDCLLVSKTLYKIINNSLYKKHYKQANIYAVFGSITYLLNSDKNKSVFNNVRKMLSKSIDMKNIKINEREYTKSEKILAFAIKYNLYYIAKITMKRITFKKP